MSMWQREILPQTPQRFGLPTLAVVACVAILHGYQNGRFTTLCGCWKRTKRKLLRDGLRALGKYDFIVEINRKQ